MGVTEACRHVPVVSVCASRWKHCVVWKDSRPVIGVYRIKGKRCTGYVDLHHFCSVCVAHITKCSLYVDFPGNCHRGKEQISFVFL